jgi:hypothetical protein
MRGILQEKNVIRGRLQYDPSRVSTDDANAKASDILTPKTAYVRGEKVTGSLQKATLEVTENGEYKAPDSTLYDQVNVAIPDPPLADLEVTKNGVYAPDEGVYGFGQVTVEVQPDLVSLEVVENGEYTPDEGVDGFGRVVVAVPDPVLPELVVTEDGVYVPTEEEKGFSQVTVDVGCSIRELLQGTAEVVKAKQWGRITTLVAAINGILAANPNLRFCDLPAYITAIPAGMYKNCQALTEITIHEKIAEICGSVFANTTALETVYFNAENAVNTDSPGSYGDSAFFSGGAVHTVVLGEKVRKIPHEAFYGCSGLAEINLANVDVEEIGYRAFYNCTGLTDLTIPESVISIAQGAFGNTTGLKTVYYNAEAAANPSSINTKGGNTIFGGSGVTRAVFGSGVTVIPKELFAGAANLVAVDFGQAAIKEIGLRAFYNCTLLESITIPASVEILHPESFANTTALGTVYYNAEAAENTGTSSSIGKDSIFTGCGVTNLIIGDEVKSLPQECFYGCSSLTDIEFGNGLTAIEIRAFGNCTALTSVTIPANVTTIHSNAFYKCTAITDIYVPWAEGAVSNAPWGATNAKIHYNHTGV